MVRVAVAQIETVLLDPQANLQKIDRWTQTAADRGADLVVFPECAITGYDLSAEEASHVAESIPGPRTKRLAELCAKRDILVVVGTLEEAGEGNLFNTALLMGPEGVLGKYQKTHLPFLGVDRYLMQGSQISAPVKTPLGSLGLLICYDLRFPEPTRVLALAGAEIVLLPTAWPRAATLYPDFMARSRAAENRVYLVAADRVGRENKTHYLGRSVMVGPDGETLAEASVDTEELLIADIDPLRTRQKLLEFIPGEYSLDLFNDRRPDLYASLARDLGETS
jgi:predicted amidohydrolase